MNLKLNEKFFTVLAVSCSTLAFSQVTTSDLQGKVTDKDNFPVSGALINIVHVSTGKVFNAETNSNGNFSTKNLPAGGPYTITVTDARYPEKTVSNVFLKAGENNSLDFKLTDSVDLQEIVIVGKGIIDISEDRKTPIASTTITKAEIQDLAQGNVDFTEAMSNTPNVYVSNQSGGFGDSKMYTRGFDQSNTAFLFNGQPINGMEDGKLYWSNWSGMTDIANALQVQRGLGSSKLAISSVGGTINIVTKATEKRKGGYIQFTAADDYYFKGAVGYNSGLKGKWGYSIALSHWQADRNYARGTYGNGQSYFLSIGYKPNENHLFNFIITGAPQLHGQNYSKSEKGALSYETFGKKWNPNYGFKNGAEFSWRQNYYHKPIINLNWDWTMDQQTSLSTVLYGSFGRGGGTGSLGNTKAPFGDNSTSIDYFRSGDYYNMENGDFNFDKVVENNRKVAGGIGSYNRKYGDGLALRASVNNHQWFGLVSNFNKEFNDNLTFNFGVDGRMYHGDHFRQIIDLLGLQGYRDNNNRDASLGDNVVSSTYSATPWAALFNYAKENERVGYDSSEKINYIGAFSQLEYANDMFSAFFQGSISNQSYQRFERWREVASSDVITKLGYNVKGGASFATNDNSSVYVNAGYYSRQPFLDNIFENNTNKLIPNVENEEITGLEAGYRFETKAVQVNINLYYTKWSNRFISQGVRKYVVGTKTYSDATVNYRGLAQLHKGFEIDFKAKPTTNWDISGHFTYGDWNYDGETPFQVVEEASTNIVDQGSADLKGVKVGEAPQVSFNLGSKLNIARNLSWDANMNFFGKFYGFVNTGKLLDAKREGKDYNVDKIKDYVLFNTGLTYKIKIDERQDIRLRGNVLNLFDTTYISQQEQYGIFYGRGRTWSASISYNF
ncbi:TonB-dependent receptor [Weeksellaceae bacterium TAE3-ERU29]|nr:TonB-dependent receptor [Weeksellaceae bacterium TAE3-ERU29]